MKSYYLQLTNLPRRLRFPIPLDGLIFTGNATGTFDGIRPGNIEFTLRLESADRVAVDFQDSVRYENPFPHLFIKMPHSRFQNHKFMPRKAFVMIYDERHLDALRGDGIPLDNVCWPVRDLSLIQWGILKMNELVENLHSSGVVDRLDSMAWHLLHEIVLAETNLPDDEECVYLKKIQQIASCYRRHYAEKIHLEELLAQYGLSRRTFYRYWPRFFDLSPKQFQLSLRLQEAARLFSYDHSVSEVAALLNFADVSSFAEQFKRYWGMTPSEMKKRIPT